MLEIPCMLAKHARATGRRHVFTGHQIFSYNFATFNVSAFIIHDPWKAFNVTVQRSVPHWTSTGARDSWDGWIWSYGNGCGTQYTLLAKHVLCSCLVMFFHVVCSRFLHIFIVWMFFMFVFKTINLQDVLVPRAR